MKRLTIPVVDEDEPMEETETLPWSATAFLSRFCYAQKEKKGKPAQRA
jgi:hypothetical protein